MIILRQMPDAKKHSDNTIIMVQPIIQVQNFEFRHRITQNILYICPFDWLQPPGKTNQTKQNICTV